jgi:hypothetical protein
MLPAAGTKSSFIVRLLWLACPWTMCTASTRTCAAETEKCVVAICYSAVLFDHKPVTNRSRSLHNNSQRQSHFQTALDCRSFSISSLFQRTVNDSCCALGTTGVAEDRRAALPVVGILLSSSMSFFELSRDSSRGFAQFWSRFSIHRKSKTEATGLVYDLIVSLRPREI